MINKRLLNAIPETKKYIGLAVLAQVTGLLVNIGMVFAISHFINGLSQGHFYWKLLTGVMFAALVLRSACVRWQNYASYKSSESVKGYFREALFKKAYGFGIGYVRHIRQTELVQIAVEGIEQLDSYYGRFVPQLIYAMIAPLVLFVCLLGIDAPVAIGLLLFVPVIPAAIMLVQRLAKKVMSEYWGSYINLSERFLDNVQGLVTLKIYQADEAKNEQMNREAESFRSATMRVLRMQIANITVMDLVAYGGAAIGTAAILFEFSRQAVNLSETVVFILLVADFFLPLRQLGSFFHVAMNGLSATERMFQILDLDEEEDGTAVLPQGGFDLSFEGVSFAYDERQPVLQNLSFSLHKGELLAVVGRSGCGKSTVAALLSGELLPTKGIIRYAGLDERVRRDELARQIVSVDASPWLFSGSVAENLRMAKPEASDEELWQVLKKVRLDGLLRSRDGLDTAISEGTSNFSGGQRQRLAIARALLKEAAVYIFDEATSNIDVESEAIILDLIKDLRNQAAVLLITHRLKATHLCDRICLLEDGQMLAQGSAEELLREEGLFKTMYDSQERFENYGENQLPQKEERLYTGTAVARAAEARFEKLAIDSNKEVRFSEC